VHVREDSPECDGCPAQGLGKDMLVSGLRAEGVLYGVISAVLPSGLSIDPDEEEIFSEVAHDIGFALHHLEVWSREKAAVAALTQSEEKFRDMVENIAEVIYTVDTSGILTYFSPAITGMLGYSHEEVIGHPFMEFIVPEDREKMARVYRETLEGRNIRVEFRGFNRQGQIHMLSAMSNPIYEGGVVTGVTGVISDITEQKVAEERIASAVVQIARNLEQMAILNDSIRNPLSVIVGLADMTGGETNEKILRAAREIDDIITELDRGWIESDKVRRFLQVHHHLYHEERGEEPGGREE
jgi:PAS domain S-box-containing protein